MSLIEWNDSLKLGIPSIDKDHQTLVRMPNDLADAVAQSRSQAVLEKVLGGLVNYTKTHFAREEKFFAQHGYPQEAAHKREHAALTEKALAVQTKLKNGNATVLGMEVLAFLKDWLVNHIQGSDAKYAPFLRERGVQ